MPFDVGILSVVPSPYQRDLFAALAQRPEVNLRVRYMEASAPDSPWPAAPLGPHERILPGFWFPLGTARCHVNWALAELKHCDLVVLNSLMSFTAQKLMRLDLQGRPWIFWGERLGPRRAGWHETLTSPLNQAAAIAGIGTLAVADYRARFPQPQHENIPYYCDLRPFLDAPRPEPSRGDLVFLCCGQMIARKGVDILLAAFSRIAAKHAGARLLLVGREAELPEMLASFPSELRDRVEYAGFQPPAELPRFFAKADVFVLPSRYDGWGVVVNQALGAGLAIVCSDAVGAGHDLVEPEVNGLRFPGGDSEALFLAMQRFVAEPDLASKWGEASRLRAHEWMPERGAERWVKLVTEILRR